MILMKENISLFSSFFLNFEKIMKKLYIFLYFFFLSKMFSLHLLFLTVGLFKPFRIKQREMQ